MKTITIIITLVICLISCKNETEAPIKQNIRRISDESSFYYSWVDSKPNRKGHWELRRLPIDTLK